MFLSVQKICSQANASLYVKVKDTVDVLKYELQNNGFESEGLVTDPGDYRIKFSERAAACRSLDIVAIDLVYTEYPEGQDLTELNRKRVIELFMHVPNAFNKNFIHWRFIRQTGCKKASELHRYFHGFVIYYRALPDLQDEQRFITGIIDRRIRMDDSTLFRVFKRNREWKDMVAVMDVTGSMSPYTAQMLLWLKLNSSLQTAKHIVFFNDDEERSNDQSAALDTNGIWSVESTNFGKVFRTCLRAMAGGAHYENNLEAVFYAVKKHPNLKKNIVMIADNWEDPCDMRLISKLKELRIPVRIVICGITDAVNTNYLDIAYATGGSVHTMEADLTELAAMGEGRQIQIGNMKFQLTGGRFRQLN